MRDEGLEPLTERELQELEERALDRRIVGELERVPDVAVLIPADFAARVAAKVPAKRPVEVRATSYGRSAMWVGLATVLVLLALLSTQASKNSMLLVVEAVLFIQFAGIVAWLSIRSLREG